MSSRSASGARRAARRLIAAMCGATQDAKSVGVAFGAGSLIDAPTPPSPATMVFIPGVRQVGCGWFIVNHGPVADLAAQLPDRRCRRVQHPEYDPPVAGPVGAAPDGLF